MAKYAIPGASIAVIEGLPRSPGPPVSASPTFGRGQTRGHRHPLSRRPRSARHSSAAATMIVAGRAGIGLDEDINAVLERFPPEEPGRGLDRCRTRIRRRPMTLRELLSTPPATSDFHYSGYRYGHTLDPPRPIDPIPTLYEELTGAAGQHAAGDRHPQARRGITRRPATRSSKWPSPTSSGKPFDRDHGRPDPRSARHDGEHLSAADAARADAGMIARPLPPRRHAAPRRAARLHRLRLRRTDHARRAISRDSSSPCSALAGETVSGITPAIADDE